MAGSARRRLGRVTRVADAEPRGRSPMLRSFSLEREVVRLLHNEQYDLAVLVAQTLLEVRTEAELAHFVEYSQEQAMGEAALGLLPSYNLGNARVQPFVERLVGVHFRDHCPDEFASLRAHVKRRNAIAHRGEQVAREDAEASLAAVLTMTQVLHELCYRALGMEAELEEEARQQREEDGYDEDELD